MSTATKEKLTIKWVMIEDGIIKFQEKEDTYDLSETVKTFITKSGKDDNAFKNLQADVQINAESKTVDFLEVGTAVKEETKTEQPAVSETNEDLAVETFTIAGVAVKNKGIIFKEHEEAKKWHTLDDSIDPEATSLLRGKKVKAVIQKKEKGNNLVVKLDVCNDEEQTSQTKTTKKFENNSNSSTQISIESQIAVEHANNFYASILKGQSVETILSKIIELKLFD